MTKLRAIHTLFLIISLIEVDAFSSSTTSYLAPSPTQSKATTTRRQNDYTANTRIQSMVSDEEAELLLADFYNEEDFEDEELLSPQQHQQKQTLQSSQQPIRRFKRPKKVPLIAVVGRPNVGKSALVNRLAGQQSGGAIVADEAGITRDRTYRNAEFLGEQFQLVDTGGLVFDDNDAIFAKEIREQAMIAIEESAGVIFVVDGQVGLTAMDEQLAIFLRKEVTKKMPVILAVNKCESDKNGAVSFCAIVNTSIL